MTAKESPLVMTSGFPTEATLSAGWQLDGTVTFTNISDTRVVGDTAMGPAITLTQDGNVVADPFPRRSAAIVVDIMPGASMTFRAVVRLYRHRDDQAGWKPEDTLSPGLYQLQATQNFRLHDVEDRSLDLRELSVRGYFHRATAYSVDVRGGPWELILR